MADASSPAAVGARAVLGATHALSGSQWTLGTDAIWPDADIVVPFVRRVTDATGKVISEPVPAHLEADYLVTDTLTALQVRDVLRDVDVDPIGAVWAAAPTGTTTRLHLLSGNPFAWATDTPLAGAFHETAPVTVEQRFGIGGDTSLDGSRRFGDVVIQAGRARLVNVWTPPLSTRILDTGPFELSFSDGNGSPMAVDELALVVVGAQKVIREVRGVSTVRQLTFDDVELWLAEFDLAAPTTSVAVDAPRLLLCAVRYRLADSLITSPGRIVLQPGTYHLRIEGSSTAVAPRLEPPNDDPPLRDGTPVTWHLDADFDVVRPVTLRPYIRRCSVGDSRIFQAGTGWNPTPHGIGFPAYRGHLFSVRFASPYVDAIFGTIQATVFDAHDRSVVVDAAAEASANGEGDMTALPQAVAWANSHGTAVPPDQELVLKTGFPPPPDPARTQDVSVELRVAGNVVDAWSASLSRFAGFSEHVAVDQASVTAAYTSTGLHTWPPCPTFYTVPVSLGTHLLPPDWSDPPPGWELPPVLATGLPRDESGYSAAAYLRFATTAGVRFQVGGGAEIPPLAGLTAVPTETQVAVLCADDDRPYALWLRTPEPADWRRLTARIRLWHVYPDAGTPVGLARRRPLDLAVSTIPSPDATAAFLIGLFDDRPMLLPRGVVELTLDYQFAHGDLPVLRRTEGGSSDTTTLRFIQPGGAPLPGYHPV
jgi:hypothetical protein